MAGCDYNDREFLEKLFLEHLFTALNRLPCTFFKSHSAILGDLAAQVCRENIFMEIYFVAGFFLTVADNGIEQGLIGQPCTRRASFTLTLPVLLSGPI